MWQGGMRFFTRGRVVVSPALDTDLWSGAVAFSVAISLAPCTLNNLVILPWSFDGNLHVPEELYVIYSLVVVLRFQIYKVEG
jgi:hypothetical protein